MAAWRQGLEDLGFVEGQLRRRARLQSGIMDVYAWSEHGGLDDLAGR